MYHRLSNSFLPPQPVLDSIAAHARECYPLEACGAWTRSLDGAWEVHCLSNTLPSSLALTHFQADPLEVLHLLEAEDRNDLKILGFYHSHPDAPATLSQEDIAQMTTGQRPHYPEQDFLIIQVEAEGRIAWGLYRWSPSAPLAHDRKPR